MEKHISYIVKQCEKVKYMTNFFEIEDSIVELCREDVRKITSSKGLTFTDFEWIFRESAEMTLKTIRKTGLKSIQKLLNNDIENIVKLLIQRIIANMRNIAFDKRYKKHVSKYEMEKAMSTCITPYYQDIDLEIRLEQLHNIDRCTLQIGLQKVWVDAQEDQEFDIRDFEILCTKYGFKQEEIMDNNSLYKAEQTAGGNRQLVLFFDPKYF